VSRGGLSFAAATLAAGVVLAGRAAANEPTKQECVVSNETAQDLQRSGKLVQARAQLQRCAASACPGAVRADCAERLRAVSQALPTVVFAASAADGRDLASASLAIDGAAQPAALDGSPVAVDPGTHTFVVTVAGRPPVSLQLDLKEGDRVQRSLVFEAASPRPKGAREEVAGSAAPTEASALATRRIGWTALGAGAAGVTLGTLFGLLAVGRKSALGRACEGSQCPEGQEGNIEGLHANAVASDVSFAVGVLGLGAGAVLLFAFPQSSAPHGDAAVVVRPWAGLGDVGVAGRFR
jgi:hypothetical protein